LTMIGNERSRERIVRMEVGDRIDSDHHPLIVTLKGKKDRRRGDGEGREERRRRIWTREEKEEFRVRTEGMELREGGVEKMIEELSRKIKVAVVRGGGDATVGREGREGWDEKCREKKKEVRRELRMWRKGGKKETYKEKKREYKELCERKRREENERFEREAEKAGHEREVWRVINRERKYRERVNEDIEMEEWREHFMELLGGVGGSVRRG